MRCKKCGHILYSGEIKCESCGTYVDIKEDTNSVPDETIVLEYIDFTGEVDKKELKSVAKTESFDDTQINLVEEFEYDFDEDIPEDNEENIYSLIDMDFSDDVTKTKKKRKKANKKTTYIVILSLVVAFLAVAFILIFIIKSSYESSYDFNYNKAVSLYNEQKYSDAVPYFEEAVKLTNSKETEKLAIMNMCLYDCYYASGNVQKAIESLDKVLIVEPDNVEALTSLAELYYSSRNGAKLNELMAQYKNKPGFAQLTKYMIAAPTVNIESGSYTENISLEFTSANASKIYYTMDGSIPNALSNELTGSLQLEEGSHEIKVIAISDIGVMSDVIGLTYYISYERPTAPVISVASGQYSTEKTIEISNIPEGGKAYYIWDTVAYNSLTDKFVEYNPDEKIKMKKGQNILSVIVKNRYGLTSVVSTRAYILELPVKYSYTQAIEYLKSDLISKGILENGGNETLAGKKVKFVYRTKKTIGDRTLYIMWYELDGSRQNYMYGVDAHTAEVCTVVLENGVYKIQE